MPPRTTPATDNKRPLNFSVVSCSSLAHVFFNAYAKLAERDDIDAAIHLGDYIYKYGTGQCGNVREYEPATEIISLRDYRTRHAQYKRDEDLQKPHHRFPFITIWDDHESTINSYRDGAENHTEGAQDVWATAVWLLSLWSVQSLLRALTCQTRIFRPFDQSALTSNM